MQLDINIEGIVAESVAAALSPEKLQPISTAVIRHEKGNVPTLVLDLVGRGGHAELGQVFGYVGYNVLRASLHTIGWTED